jgi:hypothetical protein
MKRTESAKFPNSIQLFKFCHKVMTQLKGARVNDQDIGGILEYNPSDCSHWKRGEKNVKSVFALAKLSEALNVEPGILQDLASGAIQLDEAYFEYSEASSFKAAYEKACEHGLPAVKAARERIEAFVASLHTSCQFATPPLYLPEVVRLFSFVQIQPIEMMDRLSRVLRNKPGHYLINYRKGDLKAQTRMSILKDLGRIIFEAERARYPELGAAQEALIPFEILVFVTNLLAPKVMLVDELSRLDARRNVVNELSALFWVPKSLVCLQMQDIFRGSAQAEQNPKAESTVKSVKNPIFDAAS